MNKLQNKGKEELDVTICKEIDIPFGAAPGEEKILSEQKVDTLEKMANVMQKVQGVTLKEHAFTLIIVLIASILVLYGVDVTLKCFNLPNSELINGVFEFLKVTLATLVGFTFSSKLHENK